MKLSIDIQHKVNEIIARRLGYKDCNDMEEQRNIRIKNELIRNKIQKYQPGERTNKCYSFNYNKFFKNQMKFISGLEIHAIDILGNHNTNQFTTPIDLAVLCGELLIDFNNNNGREEISIN